MSSIMSGVWWILFSVFAGVTFVGFCVAAFGFVSGYNGTGALGIGIFVLGCGLMSLIKPGRGPWPL